MSDLERLSVVIENGHIWEVRGLTQRLLDFRSGQKNVRSEYAECSEESAAARLLENRAALVGCPTKP